MKEKEGQGKETEKRRGKKEESDVKCIWKRRQKRSEETRKGKERTRKGKNN